MTALTIGAAVRVHAREERYLAAYRRARYNHRHNPQFPFPRFLREALVARAKWTVLREIIEAEERRVAA